MGVNSTSAYDGTWTVSDLINDPTWISEHITANLEGAFLESALFRDGGPNAGVVAFREAAAPFLSDDAEEVAEFGEIPVSDLNLGDVKTLVAHKFGRAVRISYEMRNENRVDQVKLRIEALQNTMVRSGVNAALHAVETSDIESAQVTVAWDDANADPMRDIRVAKRTISTAKSPGHDDALMGYKADAIVVNPGTTDLLLWHDSVQKFYNGNLAAENPVYRGITPGVLGGLRVIESSWFPEGEALILQTGTLGFTSDTYPLTVTDLYEEGGNSGYGGPSMSWRADAFRKRVIAIDNPLAAVRLTGIGTA